MVVSRRWRGGVVIATSRWNIAVSRWFLVMVVVVMLMRVRWWCYVAVGRWTSLSRRWILI
ncbi:hypothetical protein Hanom_Chr16g01505281 [Helianthus anomalus]